MTQYIIRRLLLAIPTLLLLAVIIFTLIRLIPGDAILSLVAEGGYATAEDVEKLRAQFNLDKPIHVQFALWIWGMARGDLGTSIVQDISVAELISKRFLVTLEIAVLATVVSLLVSIPIGILSGIRQDTPVDYLGRLTAILFISVPNFFIALLIILFGAIWFRWTPPLESPTLFQDPGGNLTLVLIAGGVTGLATAGTKMRLLRSSILEIRRQDYIRTAWAKGLRERVVVSRHMLKLALIPVVTIAGIQFARLMGALVITESVFAVNGLGRLLINSINTRDYPVIQTLVLMTGSIMIMMNLLVDLLYAWLDPRIRYS